MTRAGFDAAIFGCCPPRCPRLAPSDRWRLTFGDLTVPLDFRFDEGLLLLLDICKKIMRHMRCGRAGASLHVVHDLAEVVAVLILSMCAAL
jgi:hypothetical protein